MSTIFVTGSTGVVGGALVPWLLAEQPDDLVLLMRAKDANVLRDRFGELLEYWRSDSRWEPAWEKRLTPVSGDVTLTRLGLDEPVYASLVSGVRRIVHAAANVKMNLPLESARGISVGAMREILALTQAATEQTNAQVKVDYVSTMGVAGRMQGDIPETAIESPRAYHNTYEEAKSEAETLLLKAMRQGVHATIYRPSMVTGDSRTGHAWRFQIFHYLADFFSGRHTGGWLPRLDGVTLDLTPVDYVAAAVARAGGRPDSTGKILHLTSGAHGAMPLRELGDRTRAAFANAGLELPRIREAPVSLFRAALFALTPFLPKAAHRRLALLPVAFEYMNDRQCFVNDASRAYLETQGVAWRHPRDYADASLAHYARHGIRQK